MAHVYKDIKRPDPKIVEAFKNIGAATIHEAYGRRGAVDMAIKPIKPGLRICGPAVTVQCHPADNLMLHKAIQVCSPGDIIVATVGGHYEAGYWGALLTTSAIANGVGGLALDGCIRDVAENRELGFPIFCRGFCIKGTTKAVLGLVNHTIVFGGIVVNPGDLIVGDDDGIVVVERSKCEEVLAKSLKRIEDEQEKSKKLSQGIPSVVVNRFDKLFETLGLIEE